MGGKTARCENIAVVIRSSVLACSWCFWEAGRTVTAPRFESVGAYIGGEVARILFVRVLEAAQAKCAARVLPRLPLTIPVETKLRQNLPQLRRGRLAELNPNPFADNLGKIEQTRIAGFQKFQNFCGGQGAVFLPCFGVNRQTRIFFLRLRRCAAAAQLCGSAHEL